jgi:hypothetical protein
MLTNGKQLMEGAQSITVLTKQFVNIPLYKQQLTLHWTQVSAEVTLVMTPNHPPCGPDPCGAKRWSPIPPLLPQCPG